MPHRSAALTFDTFADVVRHWAAAAADDTAFVFLADGERNEVRVSFADLDRRARAIAAALREHAAPGEPVLLVHPVGPEFVAALIGCWYARAVAVPVQPVRPNRPLSRLQGIVVDSRARLALTVSALRGRLERLHEQDPARPPLTLVATDAIEPGADRDPDPIDPGALAMLQYTSGSTRTPRGVMLTHDALIRQQRLLADRMRLTRDSRVVTWLPPYHDMGLIGGLLQPLFGGFECVWMPPAAFLQRPLRWLQAIARFRGTTSGGPNIAYELCLRDPHAAACADLDLRSWRVAFNGSERVQHGTLTRFAEAFRTRGFDSAAFYPCYGLAEATLMVSGGPPAATTTAIHVDRRALQNGRVTATPDGSGQTLVGCGRAVPDLTIAIVDPETCRRQPDGRVGEVWVAGPGLGHGYWGRPDETRDTFHARIAGGDAAGYLRTGDLGCVVHGELFIIGRLKDVVIHRGRNYAALDLEESVADAVPSLHPNSTAVIAADRQGEERIVVVQEADPHTVDLAACARAISEAIAIDHDVAVSAVVFIRSGTMPKTASGKIQRHKVAFAYAAGTLPIVDERAFDGPRAADGDPELLPRLAPGDDVRAAWRAVFGADPPEGRSFLAAGGDSLKAVRLVGLLNERLSLDVPVDAVLQAPSFAEFARMVRQAPRAVRARIPATASPAGTDLAALPAQQRIWFLDQIISGHSFYHVAVRIDFHGPLHARALDAALNAIVGAHQALRVTFATIDGRLHQRLGAAPSIGVPLIDVSALPPGRRAPLCAELGDACAAARFDLARGPLVRAQVIRTAADRHVLVLVIHHMVCDAASLHVVLAELGERYAAAIANRAPDVAPTDYVAYCRRIEAGPGADVLATHRRYWQTLFATPPRPLALPTDRPRPAVPSGHGARVRATIVRDRAGDLHRTCAAHGCTLFMGLVCALAMTLRRLTGSDDLVIGTASANRPDPEAAALVGCLINFLPLRIDLAGDPSAAALLGRVRDACLDAYRHAAYPFERLVEDVKPAREFGRNPLYSVGLWLHGEAPPVSFGTSIAAAARMIETSTAELDLRVVACEQPGGELRLDLEYNTDVFEPATIARVCDHYGDAIAALLQRPAHPLSALYSAADAAAASEGGARPAIERIDVTIAANFTAEPLQDVLEHWLDALGLACQLRFAPQNQIVQHLAGVRGAAAAGIHIVALDIDPWVRSREAASSSSLERAIDEIAGAIDAAAGDALGCLVYVFPAADDSGDTAADAARARAVSRLGRLRNTLVVDAAETAAMYAVERRRDPFTDELGQVPFTEPMFAAVATDMARRIHAIGSAPRKVVVLDCDGTLWDGACGEGTAVVTPPFVALQRFMEDQRQRGKLLAVSSRNLERDVTETLDRGDGGVLRREHFAAARVDWRPKAVHLTELSEALGLALDSFIFVDNDPVECDAVRRRHPEVAVVELPRDPSAIPALLERSWVFDEWRLTDEDRRRHQLYQAEQHRAAIRARSPSAHDFLERMQLRIDIAPASADDAARVAQLTARVTQFNATGLRLSAADVDRWRAAPAHMCWAVRVSDVFGDYGLVGAVLFTIDGAALHVAQFVLSCRALGRGVEHAMIAKLRACAVEHGVARLVVPLAATERNAPARACFAALAGVALDATPASFDCVIPAAGALPSAAAVEAAAAPQPSPLRRTRQRADADTLAMMAAETRTAAQIVDRVRRTTRQQVRARSTAAFVPPATSLEQSLAAIWSELLGIEPIGAFDDFFAFGGHSLMAVRVLARVRERWSVELSLATLFDNPTVSGMAQAVTDALLTQGDAARLEQLVAELSAMSDLEAQALVRDEPRGGPAGVADE